MINNCSIIALQTKNHAPTLFKIIAFIWLIFIINNFLLNKKLLYLGIIPRRIYGVFGIICAPLLHLNFNHLFFNTIPLLILSNFILISGINYFIYATIFITVSSGILIWCFAKSGIHIGASALITGYWGLLVNNLIYHPTFMAIILGILSIYYFAGIFFGIFPTKKTISWQGHLFGLLSGCLLYYIHPPSYY